VFVCARSKAVPQTPPAPSPSVGRVGEGAATSADFPAAHDHCLAPPHPLRPRRGRGAVGCVAGSSPAMTAARGGLRNERRRSAAHACATLPCGELVGRNKQSPLAGPRLTSTSLPPRWTKSRANGLRVQDRAEGVAPSLPKFRPAGCPSFLGARAARGVTWPRRREAAVPGRSPRSAGARWKGPVAPAGRGPANFYGPPLGSSPAGAVLLCRLPGAPAAPGRLVQQVGEGMFEAT